ncbi:choice-of-anchor A family protein [Hyalangium rubrum]|uniref:Choice-of-anchor A family protein n=1 Tax=Hyalangium rubrum TaxID=3103134 RepID=A0ABU5H3Z9_9BACT|nr:choice-of-anchor A family protein [Hyalangium sp. s54d21]MDY7228197.1 choice-of-anchor A family protein [Hyalangium sp. s54d21]
MSATTRGKKAAVRNWKFGHGLGAMALLVTASCGSTVEGEAQAADQRARVVASADACEVQPPFTPNFQPELEWKWPATSAGAAVMPQYKQVMMTPVVVEVNGDGVPDVVFNSFASTNYTTDGVIRAISGADGSELWTVTNTAQRVRGASSIAAGDIDNDGRVELCTIPESGNGIICFEHDGSLKFRTSVPANNWGGVSFADLEGDGSVEILNGNHVFSATGALKWVGSDGMGGVNGGTGPISFAADIDGDGIQEVVNDRAVYRANGTLKCMSNSVGHGLAGVGNFDGDSHGEIVVVWNGNVSLLDDNCAHLWTRLLPGGGVGGAPNIADFDNDGQAEIGVAGATNYSVFETNGTVKWSRATQDQSSNRTGSSTFDFEGDGKAEVVYADETRLRIYDGATGAVRFDVAHSSGTTYENPVIVDVDADDSAEIVIAVNDYGAASNSGIRVFRDRTDGWVNTRRIWNQHAYSVTNVNDNGTIPAHPVENWRVPGLNTFRSNSQGTGTTSPFAAPDVIASEVQAQCNTSEEILTLVARVTNQGDAATSAGMKVAFYMGNPAAGGTLLDVVTLSNVLAPGTSRTVTYQMSPAPGGLHQVYVVADDDGTGTGRELECREDNNVASATLDLTCSAEPTDPCIQVRLNDYNLFLLEDYNLGTDVEGKVAAGGNITMNNFAVGSRLPETDTANVLVAGGNLTLSNGAVWGEAAYGGTLTADQTVLFPRGPATQGTPIDFAARGNELRSLSSSLANLAVNGTTTLETWGGIMLRGTDANVNVFTVNASSFTGATLLYIEAPASSLAVVNIYGASAHFSAFGHSFSGVDEHGVLYNFVDTTSITANGFGFWGTVLAPYADVNFSNGSWDGGMYAKSLTGYAEGHINALNPRDICVEEPN